MSIVVDSNNPTYSSANGLLLSKNGNNLFQGVNGDILIPESVTSIRNDAFSGCSGLMSVTIPDSVTSIGDYAFSGCSGLKTITIPDSVTKIGYSAFYGCSGLTSVTIPDSVRSIWNAAFFGCSGLTSITIPDSVTNIGYRAFYGCSGLTSITIPEGVTSIESQAFSGCSGLNEIWLPPQYSGETSQLGIPSGCRLFFGIPVKTEMTVVNGSHPLVLYSKIKPAWYSFNDETASDGVSIHSGLVDAGGRSTLSATAVGPGTLSFDWKISAGRGDSCRFYVTGGSETNSIQRSTGWKTEEVTLGAGTNTLQWVFERGSGDATGADAAFLDNVDWRPDVTLAVTSAFGSPVPAVGSHVLCYGDSVSASVGVPEPSNGVRHICMGWTGAGSVPPSGEGTEMAFAITNDTSLVWNWRTDYWISLVVEGAATADFAQNWLSAGSTNVVNWMTPAPYFTVSVSGDTNGVALDEATRTLAIPADRPRTIVLSVTPLTIAGALDAEGLAWTTEGAATWYPQVAVSSDGEDAARSGIVTNGNEASVVRTTVEGPGTFAWSWRIDAAGNAGVDVLLDGEWLEDFAPGSEWTRETLNIAGEGRHTVRFEFWNAGSSATYGDCAYLDRVAWTGGAPASIVAGGAEVSLSWIESEAAPIILAEGGDHESAALATAANGVNKVWECYVAGLSPTNAAARFEVRIEFDPDGNPVVKWSPDLNENGTKNERVYTVEGKETLSDGWGPTNANSRFFHVKVRLPE